MDNAATLTWIKIKTSNAHDSRAAIAEIERFTGDVGELNHFIKAVDRVSSSIAVKAAAGWLDAGEVPSLRAALINRISRQVLNLIQSDEDTEWAIVKERLKRALGGGRWAPEEDLLRMFRAVRGPRQSVGEYVSRLLDWHASIAAKLGEQGSAEVAATKMSLIEEVLKTQLRKETALPVAASKTFLEAAKEMIDEDLKNAEDARREREARWTEVRPRRPERYQDRPRARDPDPWRKPERNFQGRPRPGRQGEPRERKRCHECGSTRHLAARCERRACFECGAGGHMARNCPHLKRRTTERPEPMEINLQRVNRRPRTFAEALKQGGPPSESDSVSVLSASSDRSRMTGRSQRSQSPRTARQRR